MRWGLCEEKREEKREAFRRYAPRTITILSPIKKKTFVVPVEITDNMANIFPLCTVDSES